MFLPFGISGFVVSIRNSYFLNTRKKKAVRSFAFVVAFARYLCVCVCVCGGGGGGGIFRV